MSSLRRIASNPQTLQRVILSKAKTQCVILSGVPPSKAKRLSTVPNCGTQSKFCVGEACRAGQNRGTPQRGATKGSIKGYRKPFLFRVTSCENERESNYYREKRINEQDPCAAPLAAWLWFAPLVPRYANFDSLRSLRMTQ